MTLVYGFLLGVASSIVASILYRLAQLAWLNRRYKVALQAEIVPDVAEWAWTVALPSILPQDRPIKVPARDLREWLDQLGAVEIGEVTTRVRLTGLAQRDVIITNISATIIQDLDCLSSTRVVNPDAGASDRLSLYFDLDHSPGAPVQQTGERYSPRREAEPYFKNHYLVLRQDEMMELDLIASTSRGFIRFYWTMTYAAGKSSETKRIGLDDPTSVIQLTGESPTYQEDLVWAWHKGGALVAADDPDLWNEEQTI